MANNSGHHFRKYCASEPDMEKILIERRRYAGRLIDWACHETMLDLYERVNSPRSLAVAVSADAGEAEKPAWANLPQGEILEDFEQMLAEIEHGGGDVR